LFKTLTKKVIYPVLQKKEIQQKKKEPAVHLSRNEFIDMIRDVIEKDKNKKE